MKLVLSWLREFLPINLSPEEISHALTMGGLEVEALHEVVPAFSGVVVGEVRSVRRHPQAEKLVIAQVFDGKEEHQVVCGASNCREGVVVPFAKPGAVVGGKTLQVAKLRGETSNGMLCAADELGLSDTPSDGLLILSGREVIGSDFAESLRDWVFSIALTPNLGHCASVFGVARELSALTGLPLPAVDARMAQCPLRESPPSTASKISVKVEDSTLCPSYTCRMVDHVKVGSSPYWVQRRLELSGLPVISNVVDITNYLLTEWGQPLHAFDASHVAGHEIVVRSAREGEHLTTLDGKNRTLQPDQLLICDREKPLALAGVMGGLQSGVTPETKTVLLESAYFLPSAIRRSSKCAALSTEASRHFERGVDPYLLHWMLHVGAFYLQEWAGGQVRSGVVEVACDAFPPREIPCRVSRVNALLGHHFATGEIENVWKRLGFAYSWDRKETFMVTVPAYRHDINAEIDLVEEVARIYGYGHFKKQAAPYAASTMPHAPIFLFEKRVRQRCLASGLQEFLTCDLIGPALLEAVQGSGFDDSDLKTVRVLNPTSVDQSILRRSLLPGLLNVVKTNLDQGNRQICGFELGRTHFRQEPLFKEEAVLGIVMSGLSRPTHWDRKATETDFFDLKGVVENILTGLGAESVTCVDGAIETLHPGRRAVLFVERGEIGLLGEVHPDVLRRIGISERVYFAEINLHALHQVLKDQQPMQPLPIYPGSERDWTCTVPIHFSFDALLSPLKELKTPLLEKVALIDLYRGDQVEEGKQNLTLRFLYRDREKTIQQETVDSQHAAVIEAIRQCLPQS